MAAKHDVIIIGSGAGGGGVAYQLAMAGKQVLLIEQGPFLPRDASTLSVRQVFVDGVFKNRTVWRDGQGSEFVVRLPRVAKGESMPTTNHDTPVPQVARRRILIVDDNEDGAMSLSMLLNLSGHETFTANNGYDALAAFEQIRPDVALVDIGLPGLNGFEVARRIRDLPLGRDAVLVAVTGWGQEDDRTRSRESGFDAHLVKPVNHQELMKLLAKLPSHAGRA